VTVSERALDVLAGLRPQAFGTTHPSNIKDPIVEPMWSGIRVLAAIDGRSVRLQDGDGEELEGRPDVVEALADAIRAEGVVVDGYLTKDTSREVVGVDPGLEDVPTMGRFMTQSLFGTRRSRSQEVAQHIEQIREGAAFDDQDDLGFVAVDLLWLDGESITDVPLLERKRLLETVVAESELIRLGIFVRVPIDTWVASWRAMGFLGMSFRAANSRYFPGEKRKDWTTAWMPRR
jgi:ATP-dependent DNA ligase